MTTPKLALPELVVGQAGKELTHNQALAVLDQLAQAVVVDKDLATPPVSPANGAMYIVAAGATGAWSGQSGKLAYWLTSVGAWTFATPVNGWSVWVTDEAKRYELLAGVWSIVATGGGSSSGKNLLINGCFRVNQLALSGTVTLSAGAYGHDGWKAGASGCTYTFSESGGVTTLTISAGSLIQVADAENLVTGTHVLSWSGTSQGKIGAGSYSASGVIASVTGGVNLDIEFNAGTLSQVQFELGSLSGPVERLLYSQELAACQRYFFKTFSKNIAPAQNSGSTAGSLNASSDTLLSFDGVSVRFPVDMRSTPTITTYNPLQNNANWLDPVSLAVSTPLVNTLNSGGLTLYLNNGTTFSSAAPAFWYLHFTASARL